MLNNAPQKGTWGGDRPGAGQKPKWLSGETSVVRVPKVLTDDVLWYARLIDGQFPNGLQPDDCLSCQIPSEMSSHPELKSALAALQAERDELDKECSELANRLGDVHLELDKLRSETSHDSVTRSSDIPGKQEIIDLLIEATKLKANAGGAIKGKIRQVIELLSTTK